MQNNLYILFVLFFPNLLFSQIHIGTYFGVGYNKELIYYYHNQQLEGKESYMLSYKVGIFGDYSLTKKIDVNTELNYFRLRTYNKLFNIKLTFNYIEIPIYFDYSLYKLKIGLGIVNNLNIKPDEVTKIYTIGLVSTLFYPITNKIGLQLRYSRELTHNNIFILGGGPSEQREYNQNFTLNVYYKFK